MESGSDSSDLDRRPGRRAPARPQPGSRGESTDNSSAVGSGRSRSDLGRGSPISGSYVAAVGGRAQRGGTSLRRGRSAPGISMGNSTSGSRGSAPPVPTSPTPGSDRSRESSEIRASPTVVLVEKPSKSAPSPPSSLLDSKSSSASSIGLASRGSSPATVQMEKPMKKAPAPPVMTPNSPSRQAPTSAVERNRLGASSSSSSLASPSPGGDSKPRKPAPVPPVHQTGQISGRAGRDAFSSSNQQSPPMPTLKAANVAQLFLVDGGGSGISNFPPSQTALSESTQPKRRSGDGAKTDESLGTPSKRRSGETTDAGKSIESPASTQPKRRSGERNSGGKPVESATCPPQKKRSGDGSQAGLPHRPPAPEPPPPRALSNRSAGGRASLGTSSSMRGRAGSDPQRVPRPSSIEPPAPQQVPMAMPQTRPIRVPVPHRTAPVPSSAASSSFTRGSPRGGVRSSSRAGGSEVRGRGGRARGPSTAGGAAASSSSSTNTKAFAERRDMVKGMIAVAATQNVQASSAATGDGGADLSVPVVPVPVVSRPAGAGLGTGKAARDVSTASFFVCMDGEDPVAFPPSIQGWAAEVDDEEFVRDSHTVTRSIRLNENEMAFCDVLAFCLEHIRGPFKQRQWLRQTVNLGEIEIDDVLYGFEELLAMHTDFRNSLEALHSKSSASHDAIEALSKGEDEACLNLALRAKGLFRDVVGNWWNSLEAAREASFDPDFVSLYCGKSSHIPKDVFHYVCVPVIHIQELCEHVYGQTQDSIESSSSRRRSDNFFSAWTVFSSIRDKLVTITDACKKLEGLDKVIERMEGCNMQTILSIKRSLELVHEGPVDEVVRGKPFERQLFLLSDALVFAKPKHPNSSDVLVFVSIMSVDDVVLKDIASSEEGAFVIQLIPEAAGAKVTILNCKSAEEKKRWIEAFHSIPNIKKRSDLALRELESSAAAAAEKTKNLQPKEIPFAETTNLKMRARVIQEIIETEEKYLEDLCTISEVWQRPLEGILSTQEILSLFSNVAVLYNVNSVVLSGLIRQVERAVSGRSAPPSAPPPRLPSERRLARRAGPGRPAPQPVKSDPSASATAPPEPPPKPPHMKAPTAPRGAGAGLSFMPDANTEKPSLGSIDLASQRPEVLAQVKIGAIFKGMADYFKIYAQFCSNFEVVPETVVRLQQSNPAFATFCEQTRAENRNLGLMDFLIKPLQRITKYPLLLREVLKNTSRDHPDYEACSVAFQKVEKVALSINEFKRGHERRVQILAIQDLLEGIPGSLNLVEPSRQYVRDAVFHKFSKKKVQERKFWLFNDVLLYAKIKSGEPDPKGKQTTQKKKKKLYTYKGHIFIQDSLVKDAGSGIEVSPEFDSANAFQLVPPNANKKYIIFARSREEKEEWIELLSQLITDLAKHQKRIR